MDGAVLFLGAARCRLLVTKPETTVLEKVGFFVAAGSGVYFTRAGAANEVYHFDGRTGEVAPAFRPDKPVGTFSVSFDERTLIFATMQNSDADLYYFAEFK